MNKDKVKALISGVSGQDGSFLSEYLLDKGYEVYGIIRRIGTGNNLSNLVNVLGNPKFHLIHGDICDPVFMTNLIKDLAPHKMYNLGAASHVGQSFKEPVQTLRVNGEAVLIQLEAIRRYSPLTKYVTASTSELYGGLNCPEDGYNELSNLHPRSPYAIAKAVGFYAVINYREAYDLHVSNSICFNHGSCRRPPDFAERKISMGIAKIVMGLDKRICMGNMGAYRDLGHSKDYVKAFDLISDQDKPGEWVIATGETASMWQMLDYAASLVNLDAKSVYEMDPQFMRPSDVPYLKGDSSKIRSIGWSNTYNWKSLLREMLDHDLKLLGGRISV